MSSIRTVPQAAEILDIRASPVRLAAISRATIVQKDEFNHLPRGNERIVFAEDEVGLRHVTTRLLTNLGYQVDAFPHGDAVLDEFERAQNPYTLLLTDYDMPGLNGYQLAQRLRATLPQLRVILSSAWPEERILPMSVPSDWPPYLAKPYTPARLALKIREVLDDAP